MTAEPTTQLALKCKICGATHNAKGKPFNRQGLNDHRNSHYTQPIHERKPMTPDFDLADDIGDDLPDGAYFALVDELEGW